MRSLIVIPTYNEAENIAPLIKAVLSTSSEAGQLGQATGQTEILVVDDGSPDGTGTLVDEISKTEPRVHCMHRQKKMGLGTAYVAGFKWGLERGFDALIEMDADFSHDPKYLPNMLGLLEKNDVVIGSRYVEGGGTRNWGLGRRILSKGGSFYARTILGVTLRDMTGGFNGWRRRVVEKVHMETLKSDGYSFQIELKYRAACLAKTQGYKIVEFPIIFEDRKVGKSKMNRKIVLEALGRVWEFRCNRSRFFPNN